MVKRLSLGLLFMFFGCSILFAAAKFPFPQQFHYAQGIIPAGISHTDVQNVYNVWLKNFYEEQGDLARIKFDNPAQTVSEGIGYGMLILVFMDNASNNTQQKFDRLWNYWKKFPSSGALMHWKTSGFSGVVESGSATDGDIDAALALVLASKQWGDEKYLTAAKAIMKAIKDNCVSGNVLDGGDQWNAINPSYMSTVATQVFQDVDPSGGWSSIQSGCYSSLKSSQNGSTGMWPNWTGGGVGNCPGCYGFDAARVPWRMGWAYAWYGHADAKSCCTKIADWFKTKTGDNPGTIGQIYNLDGSINTGAGGNNDNIPTYLGPLTVAGMVDAKFQSWVDKGYTRLRTFGASNDNYYNECLELLCMLLLTGNMPDFTKVEPKTTATLKVMVTPDSAGTVTITPQNASYARGESVTLTVVNKDTSKYAFVGWSGDFEGTETSVTVKLMCDMNITATFKDKLAEDFVDDCEDNNARTFLRTPWFTFTDVSSKGKSGITPATDDQSGFKMTEGGYNSTYAVKVSYTLDKGSFSGDPYVGVGFQMTTKGDPVDVSKATAVSFAYKGTFGDTTCGIKVESSSVTEAGASFRYFLKPSSTWKEIVIPWKEFTQPKWATKPTSLDLKTVTKFQWQVQAKSGSGELWLDDIRLIGYYIERPSGVAPSHNGKCSSPRSVTVSFAGGALSCDYSTPTTDRAEIGIMSLDGRKLLKIVDKTVAAGKHQVKLPLSGAQLSSGSYLVYFTGAHGTTAQRLVINR